MWWQCYRRGLSSAPFHETLTGLERAQPEGEAVLSASLREIRRSKSRLLDVLRKVFEEWSLLGITFDGE
jgi:hypothetical protein